MSGQGHTPSFLTPGNASTPGEGGATPIRIAAAKAYLEHNARCLFGKCATTISRAQRRPKILVKSQTTRKSSNSRQIVYPMRVSAWTISGIAFPPPLVAQIAGHVSAAPLRSDPSRKVQYGRNFSMCDSPDGDPGGAGKRAASCRRCCTDALRLVRSLDGLKSRTPRAKRRRARRRRTVSNAARSCECGPAGGGRRVSWRFVRAMRSEVQVETGIRIKSRHWSSDRRDACGQD